MAYKIIWSPKAINSFENVIEYLDKHWTLKEVINFVKHSEKTIQIISQNPYLFRRSEKQNIHEVLVTKHNLLLYQVIGKIKKVELLVFFDTRQHPKKKKNL